MEKDGNQLPCLHRNRAETGSCRRRILQWVEHLPTSSQGKTDDWRSSRGLMGRQPSRAIMRTFAFAQSCGRENPCEEVVLVHH